MVTVAQFHAGTANNVIPHTAELKLSIRTFDDGVRYYADYRRLLEQETHTLDGLFVCLTNDLNPLATIDGLERGLHVFCEKPPGRDAAAVPVRRACARVCGSE